MTTRHQATSAEGSVPFRFTAGALTFDVLTTPAELERCCTFLGDFSAAAGERTMRIGLFGPYQVLLVRGTDDWNVRVRVCATTGDDSAQSGQCISADIRRAVLLQTLTQFIAPPAAADTRQPPVLQHSGERDALAESDTDKRVLRTAVDVRRLIAYLVTHLAVPRIEVALDGLTDLQRQQAQTRITRLSEVSEYQSVGAWAVVVTIILGTIRISTSFLERTEAERFIDIYVTSAGLWEFAVGLVIVAACAWVAGNRLGALWCRLRLLLALYRLWSRVRSPG